LHRLVRLLVALLVVAGLAAPSQVMAKGARRSPRASSSSSRPQTVHVKSHVTKKGKVVKAHDRARPAKKKGQAKPPKPKKGRKGKGGPKGQP